MGTKELVRKNEERIREYRATGDEWLREDFFRDNSKLCHYTANKFMNTGIPLDELYSLALYGMLKAFNSFDLDKQVKFATYAAMCMHNEILMYLRKHKRYEGVMSLDDALHMDESGNELTLIDIVEAPSSQDIDRLVDHQEGQDALVLAGEILTERDYAIFCNMIDDERLTQKEMAATQGISQSFISRLEGRIIKKLRRALRKEAIVKPKKKELGTMLVSKEKGKRTSREHVSKEESQRRKAGFVYLMEQNPNITHGQVMDALGVSISSAVLYRKKYGEGKMQDIIGIPYVKEGHEAEAPEYRVPTFSPDKQKAVDKAVEKDIQVLTDACYGVLDAGKTSAKLQEYVEADDSDDYAAYPTKAKLGLIMELALSDVSADTLCALLKSVRLDNGKRYQLKLTVMEEN